MGHMKRRPGRMVWSFLLSVAACVASGVALAASVPITKFISVHPIDVCVMKGPLTQCAPFNTVNQNGVPKSQNSTTNPIGFVYSYTDPITNKPVYIDITRALLNQIGIDLSWQPMKTLLGGPQTLNVVTSNSACGISGSGSPATGLQSCDFLKLSQQPCIANLPKMPNPTPPCPTSPLSTPGSVMNMFFVNTLNPPPGQTGSQLYGFSWVNNNGVAIGSNTFFPPAPLTPLIDVLAHELAHNLGLDHMTFGAGPYNPVAVDPDGGALPGTPSSTAIGDCGSDYPACMANLMTAGNLRTEATVNCVAVSNPPLPGQTACASGTPSLANAMADQLTIEAEEGPSLPQSQQGEILDPSGFLQPIANSMTAVTVPPNSNSMTVTVTGAANGGPKEALLAWVIVLPGALQFNSQFHISSQSRENLVQDADWPHLDQDNNTTNGLYNLGTLYNVCAASTSQCLIVEFNVPGASSTDTITFSKGLTKPLTNADLCGARVTSVFSHGYLTTSQLACPGGVVPSGGLMASSWTPDLTAPAAPQIVNQTAFMAAASGNPPCTLGSTGSCPDPTLTGVSDANPSQEKQLCYFHGSPVQCP